MNLLIWFLGNLFSGMIIGTFLPGTPLNVVWWLYMIPCAACSGIFWSWFHGWLEKEKSDEI